MKYEKYFIYVSGYISLGENTTSSKLVLQTHVYNKRQSQSDHSGVLYVVLLLLLKHLTGLQKPPELFHCCIPRTWASHLGMNEWVVVALPSWDASHSRERWNVLGSVDGAPPGGGRLTSQRCWCCQWQSKVCAYFVLYVRRELILRFHTHMYTCIVWSKI